MGLIPPASVDLRRSPARRLSKKWHRLLESCDELNIEESVLWVSSDYLKPDANRGISEVEAGRRADYHIRSWFIHINNLIERVGDVVRKTANVYVADDKERKELVSRYKERVEEIAREIRQERNQYAHGSASNAAREMTEKGLWELVVALGDIPIKYHVEGVYPYLAHHLMSGMYAGSLGKITEKMCEDLGAILLELEADVRKLSS